MFLHVHITFRLFEAFHFMSMLLGFPIAPGRGQQQNRGKKCGSISYLMHFIAIAFDATSTASFLAGVKHDPPRTCLCAVACHGHSYRREPVKHWQWGLALMRTCWVIVSEF